MTRRLLAVVVLTSLLAGDARSDEPSRTVQLESLQRFNFLIGEWRGVGLTKRFSPQGAWQEQASAVWQLSKDSARIRLEITAGRLLSSAELMFDQTARQYVLVTRDPDASERSYHQVSVEKSLVLESSPDEMHRVYRVTLARLNDDRFTLLFEKRLDGQTFTTRIAEVVYQRAGTRLAAADTTGPVCIVTGGKGTIAVEYQGKSYYVCCTGCRDAFRDDPEGILAEAAQRRK